VISEDLLSWATDFHIPLFARSSMRTRGMAPESEGAMWCN
jgi:hypothetical protein